MDFIIPTEFHGLFFIGLIDLKQNTKPHQLEHATIIY